VWYARGQYIAMKTITIGFKFTDEQYEEIHAEAKSMNMESGEMLTEVMKFIVKDLLDTRKSRIYNTEEESPE